MAVTIRQLRRTLAEARAAVAPAGYPEADAAARDLWDRLDRVDSELHYLVTVKRRDPDDPAIWVVR